MKGDCEGARRKCNTITMSGRRPAVGIDKAIQARVRRRHRVRRRFVSGKSSFIRGWAGI